MGKMKTLIEGLKGGVRRKLEALPPKARLDKPSRHLPLSPRSACT
ncbi:hypothetical protein ACRFA2_22215 [Bacteroides hominis]